MWHSFNMIFVFWEECTRKAVIWKLPQISRLARKSLLCSVSMNTCPDDRAYRVGSVISVGTLPLRRPTQWCITLQKTQRKHQRVRKCPLKYLNPPWGEYGKARSSNIETAKQSDFPQAVSDMAISRLQFRVFRILKDKNHIEYPWTSETVWAYYSSWCGKFELRIYIIPNGWKCCILQVTFPKNKRFWNQLFIPKSMNS